MIKSLIFMNSWNHNINIISESLLSTLEFFQEKKGFYTFMMALSALRAGIFFSLVGGTLNSFLNFGSLITDISVFLLGALSASLGLLVVFYIQGSSLYGKLMESLGFLKIRMAKILPGKGTIFKILVIFLACRCVFIFFMIFWSMHNMEIFPSYMAFMTGGGSSSFHGGSNWGHSHDPAPNSGGDGDGEKGMLLISVGYFRTYGESPKLENIQEEIITLGWLSDPIHLNHTPCLISLPVGVKIYNCELPPIPQFQLGPVPAAAGGPPSCSTIPVDIFPQKYLDAVLALEIESSPQS